jgi:hypothetical protein
MKPHRRKAVVLVWRPPDSGQEKAMKRSLALAAAVLWAAIAPGAEAPAADAPPPVRTLVAVEGKGYLETVDGYPVLHLKGTPEEMGLQHGRLLAESVAGNFGWLLGDKPGDAIRIGDMTVPRTMIATLITSVIANVVADKIPEAYRREMAALAQGAGLPPEQVVACNLIPELFHCSGFALLGKVTADGKLYHGRILDYAVDQHLQDHAVLIIQEPDGKVPFVNVGYAGFVGSVTGMNAEQISIGEMGGGGVGQWNGVPMTFLVRMVLEDARTLEQAVAVFRNHPRTCEYFYVIADGRADAAVGMRAVPTEVEIVTPGQAHTLLPTPVPDTVILSAAERYRALVERVLAGRGRFTAESALRLMDAPVAMRSNLHNALMVPADGVVYVANAAAGGEEAWKQKYRRFDIRKLIAERPGERPDKADPVPADDAPGGRPAAGGVSR